MPESTNKNSLNDPTKKYFAIQRYVGIVVAFALVILTVLIYKLSNSANNGDFYDFTIADKNSPILQLNFSSNEESFDLSEFKGKPLILAFWAGWCEPCLAEMPIMLKTYGLNEGFTIITINLDSEEKYIQSGREFIDNFKPSL
ncbi:MAG: hypothetical protein CL677_03310, partial [Bdellovibrionaceae bacterium]|nr:hypothetical protein [Pseudobdellovibrionaceae bacterium]